MQILKSTPAKLRDAQCLIFWHNLSENYDIFQAYKSPSRKKQEAWEYCKDLCEERNGRNLKIIGKTVFPFPPAFFIPMKMVKNGSRTLRKVMIIPTR